MKRILVTILAIIYLGVSSGVAMTINYCFGKLSSIDIFHHTGKCSKCGMKTNGGCCTQEFKIVKLTDSHKLVSNDLNISVPVVIINNSNSIFNSNIFSSTITSDLKNHSPPLYQGVPLNILYRVFRI